MIPKTGLYLLSSLLTLTLCYAGVQVYNTHYAEDAPAKKNISTQNVQNAQNAFVQCGGTFTDLGGVDNPYEANSDTTYTFCPDVAGDVVTVTFTFVDMETATGGEVQAGCYDFLSIYSGSDTSAPLQETACGELDGDGGTPSVPESLLQAGDFFISDAADGCLTFVFSSDGSVQGEGWVADITCGPPPQCAQPTDLSSSNVTQDAADLTWTSDETSFDIEWGPAGFTPGTGTTVSGVGNPYSLSGLSASTAYDFYVCALCDDGAGGTISSDCTGPQTFTTADAPPACGGFFIDSGGLDGGYEASADETVTICPDVPGEVVTVTFTFVDIETSTAEGVQDGCWDFLSIYSGSDTSSPLQQTACGELDGDGSTPSVATSLLQVGDFFTSQSPDGCLTFTFSSDGSAQKEGWAADITCAPPADCPPPSSLMASNIGGSSAELSWTSAETTFNIEYDTTGFTPGMGTMVNGVSNPYTLTGLMPETSYEYYVCAVCDDGAGGTIVSNCTGPQTFTTDVACPAPTDLAVANETETSADLSWTSVESNFGIEWGEAGFTPGMGTAVSDASNPFTLTGLTAATAYEYYVCAVCDDGMGGQIKSECTGPFSFATAVPPPMCGGPFIDSGGLDGGYDESANETVTICPDVPGDVVTVTFTFVDIETSNGEGVQDGCWDFLSIYSGSDTSSPLQQTACGELDGDGSTPSVATSLLQAGDFFTSQSPDGCLTFTFSSDGSAQKEGWAADITCAPPADCPPPSGLMASNIGGSSAELSWASAETTFNIEYDTTGFTPGMGTMVNGVSNPYTLTGLMPETSYEYYVCAVCDDGAGGTIVSNCTGPQTFTTDVACPAPTDLAVANETETSADLSWTSVESNFDIEWGEAGFTPGMGTAVSGASNPFTLTGLTAATAYEYYVCAVCDDGMGGQIKSECTGPLSFATAIPAPTCSNGVFVDNGGSAADYVSSSSDSITICPEVAGDVVTVTFNFVDMETGGTDDGDCYDFLSIYNGSGTIDTLQAFACGELDGDGGTPSVPESLLQAGDSFTSTAADGCLTFTFSSDSSVQGEGWEATVSCAPPAGVPGCTDATACNYDAAATMDDNSCVFATGCDVCDGNGGVTDNPEPGDTCDDGDATTVDDVIQADCSCAGMTAPGCTNATACNFDAAATVDDGSCVFATGCDVCDGNGGVTDNPEPGDTCDDGDATTVDDVIQADCSCAGMTAPGCTNATACNFDAAATVDDGSCVFATGCDVCDGNGGVTDNPEPGDTCDDGDATTVDDVIQADCSCAGMTAPGCTNATACNFDAAATVDDGSCVFATGCDVCDGNGGVTDNPEPGDTCDDGDATTLGDVIQADCSCAGMTAPGCTNATACNFDAAATVDDGSCVFATGCDTCAADGTVVDNPEVGDACDDGNPATTGDVITECGVCGGVVIGCTDASACNYNPDATQDDGSCEFTSCAGCTDATACNYDANATIDDSSCVFATGCDVCDGNGGVTDNPETGDTCDDGDATTVGDMIQADCSCAGTTVPGCTDATACNYDSAATADDGSCVFATGCDTCAANGTVMDNPEVGESCDDGSDNTENDMIQSDCICAGTPIQGMGCMDATACNYDPTATIDDGTCTFPGDICNDNNPFTVNDALQTDCSCEGIDDGSGVPTVGEWGLIILALILLNLGVLYIRQTEMKIEKA